MNLSKVGEQLPVNKIKISPYHFRKETVGEHLEGLANSIKQVGLIHAISVVSSDGGFELINGHRRLEACKLSGQAKIRANIYQFTPEEMADEPSKQSAIAQFLFAANQAEPLVPIERARFYRDAIDKMGLTLEELSGIHNQSIEQIQDDLRYLNIAEPVMDLVKAAPEKFTAEHLRILAEYASPDKKGWRISADEQERLAKRLLTQEDKRMSDSPRQFEVAIKETIKERRTKAEVEKKRHKTRTRTDALRELLRQIEVVDKSIKTLQKVDLSVIVEIDLVDKKEVMSHLYTMAEGLTTFAEQKINGIKVKRHEQRAS